MPPKLRFTNGCLTDLFGEDITQMIETCSSKKEYSAALKNDSRHQEFISNPLGDMMVLALRWSRRPKPHFADDLLHCHVVCSKWLGISETEAALIGGWTMDKKGKVEYRKIEECIQNIEKQTNVKRYRNFVGMIDELEKILESSLTALNNDEYDRDNLLKPLKKMSFLQKVQFYRQHYHLGYVLLRWVFYDVVPTKKQSSNAYWHQLWKRVFGVCQKRRDYVQALMDLIILFPDKNTVERTKVGIVNNLFQNPELLTTRAATLTATHCRCTAAKAFKDEITRAVNQKTNLDAYAAIDRSSDNFFIIKKRISDFSESFSDGIKGPGLKSASDRRKRMFEPALARREYKLNADVLSKMPRLDDLPTYANLIDETTTRTTTRIPTVEEAEATTNPTFDNKRGMPINPSIDEATTTMKQPGVNEAPTAILVAPRIHKGGTTPSVDGAAMTPSIQEPTTTPSVDEEPAFPNVNQATTQQHECCAPTLDDGHPVEHPERWSRVSIASRNTYHFMVPRLVIQGVCAVTTLYCASKEFYIAAHLREQNHAFLNDAKQQTPVINDRDSNTSSLQIYDQTQEYNPPGPPSFHCFRHLSDIWKSFFDCIKLDLSILIPFLIQYGKPDALRDWSGYRYEFGNAGQDNEYLEDGTWCPAGLVGLKAIENHPHKDALCAMIGQVIGQMTLAIEEWARQRGEGKPFGHALRRDQYASKIAQFFQAAVGIEWITIQLKCLSRGDYTKWHKDAKNCKWSHYFYTMALCYIFVDAFGSVWSLKFLCNSRSAIGSWFDSIYKVEGIVARIHRLYARVNFAYKEYLACYGGVYSPEAPFDILHQETLFVDDRSPFKTWDAGDSNLVKYIQLPTGMCRSYFLSPLSHWLYEFKAKGQWSTRQILELAICGALQNSFFQFWWVCAKIQQKTKGGVEDSFHPGEMFLDLSNTQFRKISGGMIPRYGTHGLTCETFQEVFLANDCSGMDTAIDALEGCLEWLLQQKLDCHWSVIRSRVCEAANAFPQGSQFAEFRILVALEACTLAGIGVPDKDSAVDLGILHNFVYPIKVSRDVLDEVLKGQADINRREELYDPIMEVISANLGLPTYQRNVIETLLCESLPAREDMVFDVIFKGQRLFRFADDGTPIRKEYGRIVWVENI